MLSDKKGQLWALEKICLIQKGGDIASDTQLALAIWTDNRKFFSFRKVQQDSVDGYDTHSHLLHKVSCLLHSGFRFVFFCSSEKGG